jgi:hypothetical protein
MGMNNFLTQNIDLSIPFCTLLLKLLNILILSLLNIFLIALIVLIICVIVAVIKGYCLSTSHYSPVITVSRSVEGGRTGTYKDIVNSVRIGTPVYVKYEISVKIRGFLGCLWKKDIEFELVIPDSNKMKVSIHEISCEGIPGPLNGLVISKITRFKVLASCKNPQKMKLILKCECCDSEENNLYYFLIKFVDKRLNSFYQKTTSLEYIKQMF